jgi:2-phosphosulfolactate phosphatase
VKIHVLYRKEELDGEKLPGKIVVVLDVLFATTTIVAALAHGASDVLPTLGREPALTAARLLPPGSYTLSGELDANTLEGFVHPTPLAVVGEALSGKTLVYSTTNGTVALAKAQEAARVYAAALLNGEALVERLLGEAGDATVLLVCSGSIGRVNLEDLYGAGYLVSLLARHGAHELSDAALAALMLHAGRDAYEVLAAGRVGRLMLSRGLEAEVRYAAQKSRFAVVPELVDGKLRPADHSSIS